MSKAIISFVLSLLLSVNSQVSFSQSDYLDFDKESFLIGTLSDYGGREQVFTAGVDDTYFERVDVYTQTDKKVAHLIYFLFKEEHPDLGLDNNATSRRFRLHSSTLSKLIDSYYNYTASDSKTAQGEAICIGTIDSDKIETDKQKLSFLAGAYLRFGAIKHNDSMEEPQYIYDIPNSLSKAEICVEFLKDLGCKNVQELTNEYLPTKKEILFTPSERIEKMIETIETVSQEISSSKYTPR